MVDIIFRSLFIVILLGVVVDMGLALWLLLREQRNERRTHYCSTCFTEHLSFDAWTEHKRLHDHYERQHEHEQ